MDLAKRVQRHIRVNNYLTPAVGAPGRGGGPVGMVNLTSTCYLAGPRRIGEGNRGGGRHCQQYRGIVLLKYSVVEDAEMGDAPMGAGQSRRMCHRF